MKRPEIIAKIVTATIVLSALAFLLRDHWSIPQWTWPEISISDWFGPAKKEAGKKSKIGKTGRRPEEGSVVDTYQGVNVYDNGSVRSVHGRNVTSDGYNLGLKYQCVEFVKRFYYERLGHRMPDAYGNAKDFFDHSLADGAQNKARGLYQFTNPSATAPRANDILVFGPSPQNGFGHVAIISAVKDGQVQIVQQNPGPGNPSREWLPLSHTGGKWKVQLPYISGWLGRR